MRCLRFIVSLLLAGGCVSSSPPPVPKVEKLALQERVEAIRELSFQAPVRISETSPELIETYIRQRMEEEYAPGELEFERKALVLLGLIPEDFAYETFVISLLKEQVAGYYDPKRKKLFLTGRTEGRERQMALSHELTHALQDQHFSLQKLMKSPQDRNDDRRMALAGLVEGDATMVMLRQAGLPATLDPTFFSEALASIPSDAFSSGVTSENVKQPPRYLTESLLFPYLHGLTFLVALQRRGGWKEVDRAYSEPPLSTEQVLHPEKFLLGNDSPEEISRKEIEEMLVKDLELLWTNVLGEFTLRHLFLAAELEEEKSNQAASGWGGDRIWLVRDLKRKEIGLIATLIWDSEQDAREFKEAWLRRKSKGKHFLGMGRKRSVWGINVSRKVVSSLSKNWIEE